MIVTDLKKHCEGLEKMGLGALPAKFLSTDGREKDIDYSVKSSRSESILFDEEWY